MSRIETSPQLVVHAVSHTHWDREWYRPAGWFRQRLVALMDELLDTPPRDGSPFLLDGQAVLLDDYLAMRPERRVLLQARLASGVLEAGPWYVLGDELIPSGESLVRNLLAGRRVLAALGASPPSVLYSPDAFGHPAALPALAAGFGMDVIVLWRGYGGPAWPPGDTVRWVAADGSAVMLYHLAPDGYELGASLPSDDQAAAARWARLCAVLAPRAVVGLALLPNGADHHARQPEFEAALAALTRAAAPVVVRAGSLGAFAADLAARARGASLPTIRGELRASYGYTWTLQGTFGTRARQKRWHARVERSLVRDAEPWAALACRLGGQARSRKPLVQAAWTTLLLCQPHDTLCGCSVDVVARAMDARLEDASCQAAGVRHDALSDLIGHDPARARARRAEWHPVVVVRNRAARPRGGVADVEVSRVVAPVRVGPGSGGDATPLPLAPEFTLDGGRVPVQVLERTRAHDRVESPVHYPDDALVETASAVAWVPTVRGYGTIGLSVTSAGRAGAPPSVVRASGTEMENGQLGVRVDLDGNVGLTCAASGLALSAALAAEDVGDGGDLYTHSPRSPALLAAALRDARVVHAGPLRATIEGAMRLDVPLELDGASRSTATRALEVFVTLTLDAASPFLRIVVRGENACRDHRLRLVIRTGLAGAATYADAAFGPVRRVPIVSPPDANEVAPPTAPLARYVTLATASRGVTVFCDGLAEYESTDSGDVAITLMRAVGELSRNALAERPGHAGWPAPTPDAQMQGSFEAALAILPHGGRDAKTIDLIERTADDVLLPLAGRTLRSALGVPPATFGLELEGEGLAFGACKESEHDDWTVLRCVNLTDDDVAGAWRCGFSVHEARRARLDESVGARLDVAGNTIPFLAGKREIVTVVVK